jgi:peroxiredoxin
MQPKPEKPPLRQRIKVWSINIGVILLAYLAIQLYFLRDAPSGPAPAVAGKLLNGEPVNLQQLRGQPVLVHFWATWCTICRLEQGSINDIAEDYKVVAIASQSGNQQAVQKVVTDRNITVPVLVDENGALARAFGVKAFPTTFIVNSEGQIQFREVGFTTESGLRSRLWFSQ